MINKLERKFGKYAIHNLMYYIIVLYIIGMVVQIFMGDFYYNYLSLDPTAIVRGQIWRLVTFIIYPPSTGIFYFLIGIYLYYNLGKALEYQWGAFRFNLYFFTGVLLHIIGAFVSCYVFGANIGIYFGTYYLNFSLFFAFAATNPDLTFMLFFLIPIKAKTLAIIEGIYFGITIVAGLFANHLSYNVLVQLMQIGIFPHPAYAVMALLSLGNFLIFLFMMPSMKRHMPKEVHRRAVYQREQRAAEKARPSVHKCAICGRTDQDDPSLEFRYCSKCNGNFEYCQEHLFTHTHIQ